MSLKVVVELSHTHNYSIAYLFHLRVIFFGAGEGFRNKIY
jgi:hypothetical protein